MLVEDSAAWGVSDGAFVTFQARRATFRRCSAELPAPAPVAGSAAGFALTRSSDCLIENCLVVLPTASLGSYEATAFALQGSDTEPSSRNRLLGNVSLDFVGRWSFNVQSGGVRMEGNRYVNNISINSGNGMFQRADADLTVDRHTAAGTAHTCHALRGMASVTYAPDFAIHGTLTNSVFVGGETGLSVAEELGVVPTFVHHHNVLSEVTTPRGNGVSASADEMVNTVEPVFDTAVFGKGAYLIAPPNLAAAGSGGGPIGAEVLYRYQAGQLTCVRLWPWPMEARILEERGVSVTWATGGGPWKTLAGVYP